MSTEGITEGLREGDRMSMHIDVDTRFIMLIGTPLHQSFAARMQNVAYQAAGMNMHYFYNEAGPEHLREILEGLRHTSSFAGAAITRPNKVAVMEYLDEVDPLCAKMGSCNTVLKTEDGRLIGYNTDGIGFLRSLREEGGIDPRGLTFFCIGAGGAGRSMCSVLAHAGAQRIYVTDVIEESARALVDDINANFAPVAQAVPFGDFAAVSQSDVVMNASGIGMGETIGMTPLPLGSMAEGAFYFDACYNPHRTEFLRQAEDAGSPVLNGLGMSLYQGAEQIRLWTGQEAPLDVMRGELLAIVAGLDATNRRADEPAGTKRAVELLRERGESMR